MCGRYYVDDETAREIEKLVRQVDEKMRHESLQGALRLAIFIREKTPLSCRHGTVLCAAGGSTGDSPVLTARS